VLIDAPYEITPEMMATLGIAEVVCGTVSDYPGSTRDFNTRYRHAQSMGILTVLDSPSEFRIGNIIQRIQRNQQAFQAKFDTKMERERQFYQEKHQSNGSG
jgi:ethanolamine-phosphate cytidylyltransferase